VIGSALALVLAVSPPALPADEPAAPVLEGPEVPEAEPPEAEAPEAEAPEAESPELPEVEAPEPTLGQASAAELEAARQATVAAEPPSDGPPYYTDADIDRLRERFGIAPDPRVEPRKPKWRCLIPDPVCGFGVELTATTAYAWRFRQGSIDVEGAYFDWHTARVAYDLWINFPAHTQTIGTYKFTRLTLGPKVAVVAGDNRDLWGNFGVALRYWFGTRKWSPALEFSSALSFKLAGERAGVLDPQRSPLGITADIGISVGGWGAIILGGQYDSPLAREEISEKFRISAGGQVFVGFRGNILWGAPAAAAVGTHAAMRRLPPQP
jgi:hypothetical protein